MLLAALVLPLPGLVAPPAQAQTAGVLVSNMGQEVAPDSNNRLAQPFKTGTNTAGYELTSVELFNADFSTTTGILVRIAPSASNDGPDLSDPTEVTTMTNPATVNSDAINTYSAPDDTVLAANTTYHVVATGADGTTDTSIGRTNSTSEDSDPAANWSIGDRRYFYYEMSWSDGSFPLRIRINGTVKTTSNTPATGAPEILGRAQTGKTLTAAQGTMADVEGLPATFPDDYTFQWIRVDADGTSNETDITGATGGTYTPVAADEGKKIKVRVSFEDNAGNPETLTSRSYPASGTVLPPPPNTAATGAPAITGTAQVGQSLTAGRGSIADADGLPEAFPGDYTFQWVRLEADGTGPMDIQGATGRAYRLLAADEGKKVKVRVSFVDDNGYTETRPSAVYPASGTVQAMSRLPPTAFSNFHVSTLENHDLVIEFADFPIFHGGGVRSGRDTLHSVRIVILPAPGTGTLLLDGAAVSAGDTVTAAQLRAGRFKYSPPPWRWGEHLARFDYKVSNRTHESASAYPMTIGVWYAVRPPRFAGGGGKILKRAQMFTTGPNPGGYRLDSVTVGIAQGTPASPAFAIYRSPGNGWQQPGLDRKVLDLVGSVSTAGGQVFTPAAGTTEDARTLLPNNVVFDTVPNTTPEVRLRPGRMSLPEGWIAPPHTAYYYKRGIGKSPSHAWTHNSGTLAIGIAAPAAPPLSLPTSCGTLLPDELWCATMTVGYQGGVSGYSAALGYGSLSNTQFIYGTERTIGSVVYYFNFGTVKISFGSAFPELDNAGFTLHLGSRYDARSYAFPARFSEDDQQFFLGGILHPRWRMGDPVIVRLTGPPASSQQVAVEPPVVEGTPRLSGAGSDGAWSPGESVGVTVSFSEPVAVDTADGTPSIGIDLGGLPANARSAVYESGSGTTDLVFRYELVPVDGAHGFVSMAPDSLALNGGTVRSVESGVDAELGHDGVLTSGSSARSEAPEAAFENLPPGHDGTSRFTVGLRFSGSPSELSAARDAASVLEVTGGTVTGARSTSKEANAPWEVTVEPDGPGEVILRVPVRDCTDASAVCIGGQPLSEAAEATVPGTPMTAAFTETPASHDGTAAFLLHLEFSHEPKQFSYRTVRDGLFDVSGGRIAKARRLEKGRNLRWEVRVEPDGEGAVTFAARATADCAAQYAACDADGRKFAGGLSLTVPGPQTLQTLPAVSIAPAATPVTEGAAASFALTRTGDTAAALAVTVSVTESGAVLDGAPPSSATFAAGSASAVLDVATADDEAAEDASTVTAALSADAAYTVDGALGTADVVVEDDDAAPVVGTVSPIEVAENTTAVATDLAWSIPEGEAGGADAAQFALTVQGVLSFRAAKDFEAPDDADADGDYEVTVRVTDGANAVDTALVVRLADVDDTAPALTGASVDGATLTLVFDEALDGGSGPAASAFTVSVGGSARTVEAVSVAGSTAVLTLSPAVTADETVTVGYTVPTGEDAAPLGDAAGNRVASFAEAQVTNATAAPALAVVSIAAASSPVTEGAAASFVLTRTASTAAELTVTVSVGQAGSVLAGTAPTSATFAEGASEARLAVATANDAVDEADARVRASLVSGDGYAVDADNASAGVDVFDNDAAPEGEATVETLWSSELIWTDLGNDWFGGFADAFSDAGWSEDGQAFRIWYIAYDAGARELRMAHDGSGGRIGEPGELTLHVGGLTVGPGPALSAFARAGAGRLGDLEPEWEAGEQVSVRLTRTAGDEDTAPAGPGFSVADAQVNESSGAPLRFRVTLDAAAQSTVSVRYRTSNGTAHAGADYVSARGALRFAPGERSKTVAVRVLEDNHNDDGETMTLTLSAPYGAVLADATATGTISNTDAMPQAWIARFGRTVADQVIDAALGRMRAARQPGAAVVLGGQRIGLGPLFGARTDRPSGEGLPGTMPSGDGAPGGSGGLADRFGGGTGPARPGSGSTEPDRTMSGHELLLGSSFALTAQTAGEGLVSLWGRGAVTRFDGREGDMTLDGEVASAMLGTDWSQGRWTMGLLMAHSLGEGGYRDGSGSGTVESTLTGLYPWLRHALSERVEAWGVAGYGEGGLTLTPEGSSAMRTDLDLWMAAAGLRGTVLEGGDDGLTLTAKTDAMIVETSTDAVSGAGGRLAAAQAEVTRLRLGMEATRPFRLADGSVLTPGFEVGVRHDGGDAEIGFGADIGAGLAWSDPKRGLAAELKGRGLLTHEAKGFRERGLSGAFSWEPVEGGRGPRLSLTQTLGGAQALLGRGTLDGLGANENGGGGDLEARRLEARFGYGFAAFGDRFTFTPEAGVGLSDTGREVSLGWRLVRRSAPGDLGALELSFEARRRESASGDTAPEHEVGLRLGARF